jgi:hypothetical protein
MCPDEQQADGEKDSALLHSVTRGVENPGWHSSMWTLLQPQADLVAAWKETVGDTAVVMTRDQA